MIKYKKLIYHLYFYVLVIVFTPNLILGDICAQSLSSDYIVTKDGTKLAADIYKPDNNSISKLQTFKFHFFNVSTVQILRFSKFRIPKS